MFERLCYLFSLYTAFWQITISWEPIFLPFYRASFHSAIAVCPRSLKMCHTSFPQKPHFRYSASGLLVFSHLPDTVTNLAVLWKAAFCLIKTNKIFFVYTFFLIRYTYHINNALFGIGRVSGGQRYRFGAHPKIRLCVRGEVALIGQEIGRQSPDSGQ